MCTGLIRTTASPTTGARKWSWISRSWLRSTSRGKPVLSPRPRISRATGGESSDSPIRTVPWRVNHFDFSIFFKFEFADPAIRLPKGRGPKIGVPSNNRAAKGDNLRRTSRVAVSWNFTKKKQSEDQPFLWFIYFSLSKKLMISENIDFSF